MKPVSLEEIRNLFNEGFEQVVLPYIERTKVDIVKEIKQEFNPRFDKIEETLDDHTFRLDRMERMLAANIHRTDEHSVEIKKIKKHVGVK